MYDSFPNAHLPGRIHSYFHSIQVAHDGSVSPLLGLLQIDVMVWPGMGSEVVFELYKNTCNQQYYIRVLWSGQPMKTSTPLGTLDMVKIEDFFACKFLRSDTLYAFLLICYNHRH